MLSLLLVSTLILSGCSLYSGRTSPTTKQEQTMGINSINIQNFTFSPETLAIKKGTIVTWTNNDSAPHQIKSDIFNSTELANGQSFSFTFTTPGSFDYSCSIHPSMTGKIVVE